MKRNTTNRAIEQLNKFPFGVTCSTVELAELLDCAVQTIRALATSKKLSKHRHSYNATSGVRWGSPATIGSLTSPENSPAGVEFIKEAMKTFADTISSPTKPAQAEPLEDDEEDPEDEPILGRLELAQSTIKKMTKDNKRLRLRLADRTEMAYIIAGAVTPISVPTLVLPSKTGKPKVTFCVALADIHAGEVVDAAQMGGANEYNWDIAQAGMRDIIQRMMSWAETQRGGYDITDCQLWVLGDVTTGGIHESQHLEFPSPVASAKAGLLLAEVYGTIAQKFNLNVVQISGNHDRLTHEQPFKSVNYDSLAYPAFVIASEAVKNIPHVNVSSPEDPIPVTQVNGRWIAAMHGHQIKSTGASPYYGMARRANALLRERLDRGLPKLDTLLLGHFHHFALLESNQVVICPSLVGPTEWSRQQGFQGTAGQLAFLVGEHGPFSWTPFERRRGNV